MPIYSGLSAASKYGVVCADVNDVVTNSSFTCPRSWIDGTITPTWEDQWHHQAGIILLNDSQAVIDTTLTNVGDGVSCSADGKKGIVANHAYLSGLTLMYVHDDAIENDVMGSLSVYNCELRGIAIGVSCRFGSYKLGKPTPDGRNNTISIDHSLFRLAGMPGTWIDGMHGGFFKWAYPNYGNTDPIDKFGHSPALWAQDSMFVAGALPWKSEKLDLPDPLNGWNGPVGAQDIVLAWVGPPGTAWPESHLVRWKKYTTRLNIISGNEAKQEVFRWRKKS